MSAKVWVASCVAVLELLVTGSANGQGAGAVVAWGPGVSDVTAVQANFIAVAAGASHSLGLKADGSLVAWGLNNYGECNVPAPNSGFVGVAAGGGHSLARIFHECSANWRWDAIGAP